jgi:hypothetical protein
MKLVILTRTGFHHNSFINRLQENFDISCVVRESYPDTEKKEGRFQLMKRLLRRSVSEEGEDARFLEWFHRTYSAGFRYHPMLKEYLLAPFDLVEEQAGTQYVNVNCGEVNSSAFESFLKGLAPGLIAVLGSSVIKPHVISIPKVAMINLHSGLSPYYRGTWSYGWPIVNGEPGYIGATVHHVDHGIDTGRIIHQTRPSLSEEDDLNSIFLKVIAEGTELMVKAIDVISGGGQVPSYSQPQGLGKLYTTKDLDAAAARTALGNLGEGLIRNYLSRKEELDSQVTLYGYVPPAIF